VQRGFAAPVADLPRDHEPLLIKFDGAAGLAEVLIGYAEIAQRSAVAAEAIQATGFIAEDRRDVGLLAVTSADRLNAGWTAAMRARERGVVHGC
jgi:hypothetical protein